MTEELYKGYVPCKNKRSLIPFKGECDLLNFEQVENLPEYAGILADDVVLVDIDDGEQSDILLKLVREKNVKCRVYKTTRGAHFLFKRAPYITTNKTGCKLAIGLVADIKLGERNSYEVLKFNNVERAVLYDSGEYDIVPRYLTPVNSKVELLNLEESDGRNQVLFNYIIPLQNAEFTITEIKECIHLINEYVFKDPLPEKEITTILREEAFGLPVFFTDKGKFLFDRFARYMRANNNIIMIDGNLHIFRNGIYVQSERYIEAEMIKYIPQLNDSKRKEVLSYMRLLILENTPRTDANYIAFANGVYNLIDEKLEDFNSNFVITNQIPHNYNPNAYSEIMDKTLNKMACHDPNIRALMEEMIGYCFYTRNELGKAFILLGDKSNGKSTFLDVVKTLLGENNISSLDLNELNARFKTAELAGKVANIGDDIGDEFIPDVSIFKKLVTGDRINVERKYGDPFDFNPYAKFLFSANNMPRIKDKTGAVQRRITIVPFDAKFSKDDADFDPYIKYKLRENESMEYLINIGLAGLKRVLLNRKFTSCERIELELSNYEKENNPIIGFLEETVISDIENQPTKSVYKEYCSFCISNNLLPMSNIEFSKNIKKRLDLEIVDRRIDGRKYRVFVKS